MKFQYLPAIMALCALTIFTACGNDANTAKDATAETAGATTPEAEAAPTAVPAPTADPSKPQEPAQNAAGVWHYTCPKGCAGGAGSATACAKCGTTLVHNTVYHGTAAPTTVPGSPAGAPGQAPVTVPAPAKAEPPQNAAGVWHYTCPGGCPGGAGAAVACAKCSKTLVHNTAYHQ